MPGQLLPFPPELRVIIYDHLITDKVVLPGPLPDGIPALLTASVQTKSEVLDRLWRITHVTWQGSYTSTLFEKFRKNVVPQVRRLTIVGNNDIAGATCKEELSPSPLLEWLRDRLSPGTGDAIHPLALRELNVRDSSRLKVYALDCRTHDLRYPARQALNDGSEPGRRCLGPPCHNSCLRWIVFSCARLVRELRRLGVTVTVETLVLGFAWRIMVRLEGVGSIYDVH